MHSMKAGLECVREGVKHARLRYWQFRHLSGLIHERDQAFAAYLARSPRGLHIGAEGYTLENWFNTDLQPAKEGVYYLDATQPFPFPQHSFDFIFSEHMIEHIPMAAGLRLLSECRRVLKPSGIIRIATPDLRKVFGLLVDNGPATEAYMRWAVEQFQLPQDPFPKAPQVVNNFFRAWGHQFIYDPETLQKAMQQAGFRDLIQQRVGVSLHTSLQRLEHHGQTFCEWVNEFETMVFEATAP